MPRLKKNEKQLLVWILIPLLLVIIAILALSSLGMSDAAFYTSWIGTVVITALSAFAAFRYLLAKFAN